MAFIRSIQLHNFRNYIAADLSDLAAEPVVLCGANGAGKTNILEAISFLSPGRGLRGARVAEVRRRDGANSQQNAAPWSVSAAIETRYGPTRIGTGSDESADRRVVRINGEPARGGQSAMSDYLSVLWLTPQMDRLFIDGAAGRRKFLDRMVFAFDPGHAGRMTRYENALRQRSRLLTGEDAADPVWLDALEATLAETGVAIAAARMEFTKRLQQAVDRTPADIGAHFPRAAIALRGTVEELMRRASALEVEEMLRYQLCASRVRDGAIGGAATGPHRSDLHVLYADKAMPAEHCSTGEQKALLIGMVLAHARMIAAERGAPPVLLLDEVAAHLDESRRGVLYRILLDIGAQVFMTGTDPVLFAPLGPRARHFHVGSGRVILRAEESAA